MSSRHELLEIYPHFQKVREGLNWMGFPGEGIPQRAAAVKKHGTDCEIPESGVYTSSPSPRRESTKFPSLQLHLLCRDQRESRVQDIRDHKDHFLHPSRRLQNVTGVTKELADSGEKH